MRAYPAQDPVIREYARSMYTAWSLEIETCRLTRPTLVLSQGMRIFRACQAQKMKRIHERYCAITSSFSLVT